MKHRPTSTKTSGTSIVVSLALLAPAVAHAGTDANGAAGSSVFGWLDLVVGVAFLAGIVLLGLFGDRVVGAIVVAVAEGPAAAARLAGRCARRVTHRRRRDQTSIVTASPRSSSPS
jgi:hypothetical protein